MFLGQRNSHHRRSNYATRIVRPAADGRYRNARTLRAPGCSRPCRLQRAMAGNALSPWPQPFRGSRTAAAGQRNTTASR